ncbi:MAG: hypothetical protein IH859_09890, partial [Chloroflexi bacterium]|nr:hypothetical protein [Chloroflexota bacterium]
MIAVGAGIFLLSWLLLRFMARKRAPFSKRYNPPTLSLDIPPNQNAVILVAPGGQVLHANPAARKWFEIAEDQQPNLENITRYIDPPETFLSLCAVAGEARLTSQKSLIEAASYLVPMNEEHAVLITMRKPQ